MTAAVAVWATLAGGALALGLCALAAVFAVVCGVPHAWRELRPIARQLVIVLRERDRPACARTTGPIRIGGRS